MQGPELLDHRLALYDQEQRMVFGANTYRAHAQMLASSTEQSEVRDPWVTRMRNLPATVVSKAHNTGAFCQLIVGFRVHMCQEFAA